MINLVHFVSTSAVSIDCRVTLGEIFVKVVLKSTPCLVANCQFLVIIFNFRILTNIFSDDVKAR